MVGYAAYSLLNQQHRGWYSWVLNSLVGFVYMFGFVMMTPQLFINYKVSYVWRFALVCVFCRTTSRKNGVRACACVCVYMCVCGLFLWQDVVPCASLPTETRR